MSDRKIASNKTPEAACPICGGHETEVQVTIDSGKWERQFLQCADCRHPLITDWSNTHLRQPAALLAPRPSRRAHRVA